MRWVGGGARRVCEVALLSAPCARALTPSLAARHTRRQRRNIIQESLVNGPLGRSGFLAAFSLILLSEVGDKTFFIAALLAMRLGRWISFIGVLRL